MLSIHCISVPGQATIVDIQEGIDYLRVAWIPPSRAGDTWYRVEACEIPDTNCPDDEYNCTRKTVLGVSLHT